MDKKKKTLRNLLIFILLIWLTFYLIFKDQNIDEMVDAFKNVKILYILIAIGFMLLYLAFEAINMGRTLKVLKEKSDFLKNLKYAFIGFFFSGITPAASGGQPMQVYYMYKDKISVANSTLALLINLASFQIITISIALISLVINIKLLSAGLIWFFVLGVTLNSMALALLLIGIFSKRLSEGLINIAIKILKFFKFKKIDNLKEKLEKEVNKYQGSAKYIKSNKLMICKTLITSFVQILIYYSIPYWIYCSFGLSDHNIFQIITIQAVLYATVSGIPSPGAVGASEGAFINIFSSVFPATMIGSALLLNRGVSFYLFVIISAIVVIINTIKTKKIQVEDEELKNLEI